MSKQEDIILKKGIIQPNEWMANIQDNVIAIRSALDVIEGNLCDFADRHYEEEED